MCKILDSGILEDGRKFDVVRYQTTETETPMEFRNYFLNSFVVNAKSYGADLGFWLGDVANRFDRKYADVCFDSYYGVRVEGVFAARLWFGFSKRTNVGNFGHVCTEIPFRRLGLLKKLMNFFQQDFQASGARIVTCATGNPVASRCYASYGFQMPYGGETGIMAYGENFLAMAQKIYDGTGKVTFRIADAGDQFGIDKFLAPSPAFQLQHSETIALYPDFRTALQEQLADRAVVCVAENSTGFPVGFAVIRRMEKCNLMDFMLHQDYRQCKSELLTFTDRAFRQKFPGESRIRCIAE